MNNTKNNKLESGQIIVLLAVSLVVVIVAAALAIDGGMIYSERRFAQNVADAASLAGAGAVLETIHNDGNSIDLSCPIDSTQVTDSSIVMIAYNAALDNAKNSNNMSELPFLGYKYNSNKIIDNQIDANHGIVIHCYYNEYERHLDVEVRVTTQISTAFAHLIFPGPMATSNIAIATTEPPHDLGYGYGIVSLSDQCQNNTDGMEFSGTNDVTVYGGGIHSNSCLTGSGNVQVIAEDYLDDEGNTIEGSISLGYSDAVVNGGATFDPYPPIGGAPAVPYTDVPVPTCSTTIIELEDPKHNSGSINQGSYSGLKMTGGELTLNKGRYCFYGDVEVTGGSLYGEEVMIFMIEGDIKINGNAIVQLIAPYSDVDDPYYGMLIYMSPNNPGLIALVGNEESIYSGTIYAPTGSVELGGTSTASSPAEQCKIVYDENGIVYDEYGDPLCEAVTFSTQIVAWYVKVVGTSQIDILFDDSKNNKTRTTLYLIK